MIRVQWLTISPAFAENRIHVFVLLLLKLFEVFRDPRRLNLGGILANGSGPAHGSAGPGLYANGRTASDMGGESDRRYPTTALGTSVGHSLVPCSVSPGRSSLYGSVSLMRRCAWASRSRKRAVSASLSNASSTRCCVALPLVVRCRVLGRLQTFQKVLVRCFQVLHC